MQKKLLKEHYIVLTHKYTTGVDDDLVYYLKERFHVIHIMHEFSSVKTRRTIVDNYKNGLKLTTTVYKNIIFNNRFTVYIKEIFLSIYLIYRHSSPGTKVICCDGLNTFFSIISKYILKRKITVVFWSVDFVPKARFKNKLVNYVYKKIDYYCSLLCDEKWDLSERMAEGRLVEYGIKIKDYKSYKLVPYCVWLDESIFVDYEDSEKNTIVYMGHISKNSGLELVIDLIANVKNLKLKVIGDGPHLNVIKLYAASKNILSNCIFMGKVDDYKMLRNEIARSAVAVALYLKKESIFTYYADPGKIKTYLGCGVPVITTSIPWNAIDIQHNNCGRVVDETLDSLKKAINFTLEYNQEFRVNSRIYSRKFNCESVYKII